MVAPTGLSWYCPCPSLSVAAPQKGANQMSFTKVRLIFMASTRLLSTCLILATVSLSCLSCATAKGAQYPHASHPVTLSVALYPYVPRPDQFKAVLERTWKQ